MTAPLDSAVVRIVSAFRAAGVAATLHALDLASGRELDLDADEPVVLASVFKVPLVLALHREHAAGRLDVATRARIEHGTPGATGIAAMVDPVDMSLRDLAYLAIAVSDNAAADVLFDTASRGEPHFRDLRQDGRAYARARWLKRDPALLSATGSPRVNAPGLVEHDAVQRREGILRVRNPVPLITGAVGDVA